MNNIGGAECDANTENSSRRLLPNSAIYLSRKWQLMQVRDDLETFSVTKLSYCRANTRSESFHCTKHQSPCYADVSERLV